jgi:hypothetical protein
MLVLAVSLAGCGKGAYVTPHDARLAAAWNAIACHPEAASEQKDIEEFHILFRADRDLPGVVKWIADENARGLFRLPATTWAAVLRGSCALSDTASFTARKSKPTIR